MSVADHLPPAIEARLPRDGAMGVLRRKRPSLYWLTLAVGGTAFAGVLLAMAYAVFLFPVVAGRAIMAGLVGGPIETAGWFLLMVAVSVFFVGVVWLTFRMAGEFAGGGGEE